MAISEINARAARNFRMTRLHVAEHCPRPPEDAFIESRAYHELSNFRLYLLVQIWRELIVFAHSQRTIVGTAG
jgi:hypothetical protein